jgi:acetoacetyl-CoA synthetase
LHPHAGTERARAAHAARSNIRLYQQWLQRERGLSFANYHDLWQWSTHDLGDFWQSVWDYFDLQSPTPHAAALTREQMPGAQWFVGAQVNYAQQVLRHVEPAVNAGRAAGLPEGFSAVIARNENGEHTELSWPALHDAVAELALHLQAQGVQRGDRVAAYMPNVPETMVAFLATVSLGAVWSVCAPDMGTPAVLDRFRQITPTVLLGFASVRYGHRDLDRRATLAEIANALPTVRHVGLWVGPGTQAPGSQVHADVARAIKTGATCALFKGANSTFVEEIGVHRSRSAERAAFTPTWLPFDHPLWIVYSSGTTGLPKPIVHSHGGTLVVGLALKTLHNDIGCSYHPNSLGERYFWYSSTGWVMWNAQVSGLLNGTTCCIYDGNPAGPKDAPDWGTLWRFAADVGVTFFGAGAAFFANCQKAELDLAACGDLSAVRALGTTGSPLSADTHRWVVDAVVQAQAAVGRPRVDDIYLCNISGGTDFAGAFIGGNRELPQVPGQMQCRALGCAVQAFSEAGQPVIDEVGELVCTRPIPSMPLYLWGDTDGSRLLGSYFDTWPGVWRHGDWLRIMPSGHCVIYGRSDATINRHGLRMGTSEIYSAVEALPEVVDSMVVDLEMLGRPSYMPLFVVLREGLELTDELKARIHQAIRQALSPRFVPDEIVAAPAIPRTLSGKKQELPIKKLLLGQPLEKVIHREAMANPQCLDWYVAFARRRAAQA